jgi:hypothetical protein
VSASDNQNVKRVPPMDLFAMNIITEWKRPLEFGWQRWFPLAEDEKAAQLGPYMLRIYRSGPGWSYAIANHDIGECRTVSEEDAKRLVVEATRDIIASMLVWTDDLLLKMRSPAQVLADEAEQYEEGLRNE